MPVQLQRSFGDDASNVGSRGFVLIDGTRLDLGQLLRGPLPEEEWPSEVLPEGSVDPGEAR
eukprot:8933073-Alexandrium_andersonii.AAC.1